MASTYAQHAETTKINNMKIESRGWPLRICQRAKLAAHNVTAIVMPTLCATLIASGGEGGDTGCFLAPAGQARTRSQIRIAVINGTIAYTIIIPAQPRPIGFRGCGINTAIATHAIIVLPISAWKIALRQPAGGTVHVQRTKGKNS